MAPMITKVLEQAADHIEREASLLKDSSTIDGAFDLDDPDELYTAETYASEMELAKALRECISEVKKLQQGRDELARKVRFLIRRGRSISASRREPA